MVAKTTALNEFSDNGNNRTFTTAGHTVAQPKLVIQRRKVPTGVTGIAEDVVQVLHGTVDVDGNILASKVSFTATIRRPANGTSVEEAAALVIFRDLIASDEFTAVLNGQSWME